MALPPADWPARAHSRAVAAGGLDWHVQLAGHGPLVLLLHGSGGASFSWAPMLPALVERCTVLAPDLPGHGFTTGAKAQALTLPALREALATLLKALKLKAPALVVGHSAGAALALRWAADAPQPPHAVLGFAPSLVPPPPQYGQWLAPVVTPIATSAAVTSLLAWVAGPTGMIDGLLASTGSRLPPAQKACYRRVFADPAHVRGAMSFMAAADLPSLLPACSGLKSAVHFVLGEQDRWIPERPLRRVIERHLPQATVERWPGGHLLHEEDPARAAARVLAALD